MYTGLRFLLFIWLVCLGAITQGQEPFIITWKTDNPGTSDDRSITILTHPDFAGSYNYEVDWDNDGKFDQSNITGDITYTFDSVGTYSIGIKGEFPAIYFKDNGDKSKLISIDQWGDIAWKTFDNAFTSCINMEYKASDIPYLNDLSNMQGMFTNCQKFNGNINDWDVSGITNMTNLFNNALLFNQPLDLWDVSNVTTMRLMFSKARSFDQAIDTWDVSNVCDMYAMFGNAEVFNQPLNSWDVSKVTDMWGMFSHAAMFNQPLDSWDVSNVITMSRMFNRAEAFNQDIGGWDVSAVQDMFIMFSGASLYNHSLGSWDISSVSNMSGMLDDCGLGNNNYDNTLLGWSSLPNLQSDITLGAINMKYCYAENARLELEGLGWNINGDDMDCADICNPGPVNLTWTGSTGNNWGQENSWNLGLEPTECFRVIIPTGKTVQIDGELFDAVAHSIEIAVGATFEVDGELECTLGN